MQNFRPWRVSLIISKNLQLENGKKQTNKTSKEQKTKNKKKQKTTKNIKILRKTENVTMKFEDTPQVSPM